MSKSNKTLRIILAIAAFVLGWQIYARYSYLSSVQKDLWKEFLKIQEPRDCEMKRIEIVSWLAEKGTETKISAHYSIKKENIYNLVSNIKKNNWYRVLEKDDESNIKIDDNHFVKPKKKAYIYLDYDDKKNQLTLLLGTVR